MKAVKDLSSESGLFSIKGMLINLVIVSGLIFSYFFHIVLTPKNSVVVRKIEPSFKDVFVDTRHWGISDIWHYRHVIKAIIKSGSSNEIVHLKKYDSALKSGADSFDKFNEIVEQGDK